MDAKAGIEIDVKGAERAAASIRSSLNPLSELAQKAQGAFKTLKQEMGGAISGVLSDLGRVVTVGSSISFAGAVQGVQSFEAAASKVAVATGRNFEQTRDQLNKLALELKTSPEQVANYVSGVGKATYDFSFAEKNMAAFNKFAKETGRELTETTSISTAFKRLGIEDADKALRQLRGTAESLKTVGGPAALADQFAALSGQFSKASNNATQLMAVTATIGKGLSPAQAQEAQQAIVGSFAGSSRMYETHFRAAGLLKQGESLFDATGKFDVVKAMQLRQTELRKMNPRTAAVVAGGEFGSPVAGAAFMNADFGAGFTGQESDTDAALKYDNSPGGKRAAADAQRDVTMQNTVGYGSMFGQANLWFSQFSAEHPFAAKGGEVVGTATATRLLGRLFKGGGGGQAAERVGGGMLTRLLGRFSGPGATEAEKDVGAFALKNITRIGPKGVLEMAPKIGPGFGGSMHAGGVTALLGLMMEYQVKSLMEIGSEAKWKSGFAERKLTPEEGAFLGAKARIAAGLASEERSEGMQSTLVQERWRVAKEQGLAAPGNEQAKALAAFLSARKLGAEPDEAERIAKAVYDGLQKAPVQITVLDATSRGVDVQHQPGGEQ